MDRLPQIPNVAEMKDKISEIENKVSDFADNAITLLTSILLKSILIPLLFFYALIKFTSYLWKLRFDHSH